MMRDLPERSTMKPHTLVGEGVVDTTFHGPVRNATKEEIETFVGPYDHLLKDKDINRFEYSKYIEFLRRTPNIEEVYLWSQVGAGLLHELETDIGLLIQNYHTTLIRGRRQYIGTPLTKNTKDKDTESYELFVSEMDKKLLHIEDLQGKYMKALKKLGV